jgi:hypothetical protein
VRKINGKFVIMVCCRAKDALSGAIGQFCSFERTMGMCGPSGKFWEENVDAEPFAPPDPFSEDGGSGGESIPDGEDDLIGDL